MNLYCVYYKLPQQEHALWAPKVRNFVSQVQAQMPQLQVSLYQRPQASAEGLETWMEVYQHPAGLSASMLSAIESLASALALPGKRATELFVDLPD